jgi:glutamate-5-semialdehyde dehydrogenase
MAESLREGIELPDPVGQRVESRRLENGLVLNKVRSPLGLIFLIFEARPNVITEAFSLALKSGNGLILKGGKESDRTCRVIYRLIEDSVSEANLTKEIFWGLVGASRETTDFLMQQNKFIDVLIPRGGERLIEHVTQTATMPIVKNDRGLCHIYVHEQADFEMAVQIVENAKTQRPSVCNATETLLVDASIAPQFLPLIYQDLRAKGVEFYVCPATAKILGSKAGVHRATDHSFDTEYLDLKLNVKIVENLDHALLHIERHGSHHSEAIITRDAKVAVQFQNSVDAAVVYWNASTRFTDGGQMGLGAEIGISTQKLHVRGPVGLEALTSIRWVIDGQGQTRIS